MTAFDELLEKIETAAKGLAGHYDDRVRAAVADIRDAVSDIKDAGEVLVHGVPEDAEPVTEPVAAPDPTVPAQEDPETSGDAEETGTDGGADEDSGKSA